MKNRMKRLKRIFLVLLALTTALLATGCGETLTPYQTNDAENYTVSVRFDANGGSFTTNASVVLITDSYNLSELSKNEKGNAEIALLSPDDSARGIDAFTASKNGCFLAGWYAKRTENGNGEYTYSEKWDFKKDILEVDPSKSYSSENPVLTLYAAWIPLFSIEYYSLGSDEVLKTQTVDPTKEIEFSIPAWNEKTGAIDMFQFPERSGYTFNKVFTDKNGETELSGESFSHPGVVDYATATATDTVFKLYVDWTEGEWFHIYNADQFIKHASFNSNLIIHEDLDFEGKIWPTSLMHGNFTGVIQGNGHTFKNISFAQTSNNKNFAGLFGQLTEKAEITNIVFENVNFTVKGGSRITGASFGLFAGSVSSDAKLEGVKILSSKLLIDSSCYFATDDYSIGLVCGMGDPSVIEVSEIECVASGNEPERVKITVDGNSVTLVIE